MGILKIWDVLDENPGKTYVEAVHDDYEGFRIILNVENLNGYKIIIRSNHTLAYKNTKQMFLHKLWNSIGFELDGQTFYSMENSEYLENFHVMSEDSFRDVKITHYCIYALDVCIDLLCTEVPKVEWL